MNEIKCDKCGRTLRTPLYQNSLRLSPKQNPLNIRRMIYWCLDCAKYLDPSPNNDFDKVCPFCKGTKQLTITLLDGTITEGRCPQCYGKPSQES